MILKEVIIKSDDLREVEEFLLHNQEQINKAELNVALNSAAFFGDKPIIKLLIKYGADINAREENGMTPLECAIENMHIDVIDFLLENGADVNSQDKYGVTPLHRAVDIEIEESKSLQEYPPSSEVTSLILAYAPNINAMNYDGETPLDWAVRRQHVKAIELLKPPNP